MRWGVWRGELCAVATSYTSVSHMYLFSFEARNELLAFRILGCVVFGGQFFFVSRNPCLCSLVVFSVHAGWTVAFCVSLLFSDLPTC